MLPVPALIRTTFAILVLLHISSCAFVQNNSDKDDEKNTSQDTTKTGTNNEPPNDGKLRAMVTPGTPVIAKGGTVELKALIYEGSVLLLPDPPRRSIAVTWKIEDSAKASIDEEGVLTGLGEGDTNIALTVKISEQSDPSSEPIQRTTSESIPLKVLFSDIKAINVSPTRLTLDKGGTRDFEATAVDDSGNPTEIDCAITWTFNADYVQKVSAKGTNITLSGLKKGYTLLYPSCDGITGNPAVLEVKNPTPIPKDGDSVEGESADLLVASDGIHLSYYNATKKQLKYGFFDSIWSVQPLPSKANAGLANAMTLLDDKPIICGLEGRDLACWRFGSSGNWLKSKVAANVSISENRYGGVVDLLSTRTELYLLYYNEPQEVLFLATSKNGSTWTSAPIDNSIGAASIALGNSGEPRILYAAKDALQYGSHDGTAWHIEPVTDTTGKERALALAIGDGGTPQAVYIDENDQITHALREDEGLWSQSIVGLAEGTLSFGLDDHDLPRIAYQSLDDERLHYARRLEKTRIGLKTLWVDDVPDSTPGTGSENSLAIGKDGRTHIAYYDESEGTIRYYVEPQYFRYTRELEGKNRNVISGASDEVAQGISPEATPTNAVPKSTEAGATCPEHSKPEGDTCICDDGYVPNEDKQCVQTATLTITAPALE